MKINFNAIILTFLGVLYRFIDFDNFSVILGVFWRFGKVLKSKEASVLPLWWNCHVMLRRYATWRVSKYRFCDILYIL